MSDLFNPNGRQMGVPILGQARLGPWAVTLTILCPCGHVVLLTGHPGSRAGCQACGKVYEMRGMPTVNEAGQMSVPLGVGQMAKPVTP